MAGRDPLLDRDVGEQIAADLASQMGSWPILAEVAGFFSELLSRRKSTSHTSIGTYINSGFFHS